VAAAYMFNDLAQRVSGISNDYKLQLSRELYERFIKGCASGYLAAYSVKSSLQIRPGQKASNLFEHQWYRLEYRLGLGHALIMEEFERSG